jgi:hypothetical protein
MFSIMAGGRKAVFGGRKDRFYLLFCSLALHWRRSALSLRRYVVFTLGRPSVRGRRRASAARLSNGEVADNERATLMRTLKGARGLEDYNSLSQQLSKAQQELVLLRDQFSVVDSERGADPLGVVPGSDDSVASGQGGPHDVDAHTAAGASNEPDLLVRHASPLRQAHRSTSRQASNRWALAPPTVVYVEQRIPTPMPPMPPDRHPISNRDATESSGLVARAVCAEEAAIGSVATGDRAIGADPDSAL